MTLELLGCEHITEVSLIFGFCGLLFVAISIPLVFEKIPPNNWYGFRVPKTYSDKAIWYKANRYMGKDLVWLGSIMILFNLAVFVLKPAFVAYEPLINLTLLTGGTIVVIIRSFIYLHKL